MKAELEQKELTLKELEEKLVTLQNKLKDEKDLLEQKIILFEQLEKEEGTNSITLLSFKIKSFVILYSLFFSSRLGTNQTDKRTNPQVEI
jgi:hypothetical protein